MEGPVGFEPTTPGLKVRSSAYYVIYPKSTDVGPVFEDNMTTEEQAKAETAKQPERFDVRSHDIADDKREDLLRLFPEARTETLASSLPPSARQNATECNGMQHISGRFSRARRDRLHPF